jgi:DNA-binding response OmpR family regulator
VKIGLLEDELMLREAIREYLEATGFGTGIAINKVFRRYLWQITG